MVQQKAQNALKSAVFPPVVIIMDNAKIHKAGEADTVESLLEDTVINCRVLNILILQYPNFTPFTCLPELNLIKLIFNILSRRIWKFRYKIGTEPDKAVVKLALQVIDNFTLDLICDCIEHCSYLAIIKEKLNFILYSN